jgi:hypothetical protein
MHTFSSTFFCIPFDTVLLNVKLDQVVMAVTRAKHMCDKTGIRLQSDPYLKIFLWEN